MITKSTITCEMLQDIQSFYHATKIVTHLQNMHHVSVGKCVWRVNSVRNKNIIVVKIILVQLICTQIISKLIIRVIFQLGSHGELREI